MSAILANAVRARNDRYINRLGEDMGKYLSFLSVMSRFHKYPAEDLASFAMEAPATFSAVASAERPGNGISVVLSTPRPRV